MRWNDVQIYKMKDGKYCVALRPRFRFFRKWDWRVMTFRYLSLKNAENDAQIFSRTWNVRKAWWLWRPEE